MKKTWLRLMAMLIAAVLVLSGCGGSGSSGDSKAADNGGSSQEAGQDEQESVIHAKRLDDGKIELVFWMYYGDGSYDGLNNVVNMFNAQSDKYFLRMEYGGTGDNIRQRMRFLEPKDYPSLFTGAPNATYEFANADHIVKLQEYLDKDPDKWADDIFDVVKRSYCDTDGNMIGGCLGVSIKGWMVNLDMLEQAGYSLSDITSFEKVAEMSQTAHDKGLCAYGYSPYYGYDILISSDIRDSILLTMTTVMPKWLQSAFSMRAKPESEWKSFLAYMPTSRRAEQCIIPAPARLIPRCSSTSSFCSGAARIPLYTRSRI